MSDTAPRTAPADRRRGDAILAVMQAQRAHRAVEVAGDHPSRTAEFDEAHAIVERLTKDGFIVLEPQKEAAAA